MLRVIKVLVELLDGILCRPFEPAHGNACDREGEMCHGIVSRKCCCGEVKE